VSAWLSDTSLKCVVPRGTGAALTAQVQLMECPPGLNIGPPLPDPYTCRYVSQKGASKAFSYDLPALSHIQPQNAPPSGYLLITLSGKNFGPFLDEAWKVERIDATTIAGSAVPSRLPVAFGIQAYSLATFPASSYYKNLHLLLSNKQRAAQDAGGLEFVCVSDQVDDFDGRACLCVGSECNHPACGPVRAVFNCRAARYVCARDFPRSYTECGSKASQIGKSV